MPSSSAVSRAESSIAVTLITESRLTHLACWHKSRADTAMEPTMAKRIDPATLSWITGTLYPAPFDEPCRGRQRARLADIAGLTQYGVNLLRMPPGAWSSQRHWHPHQDE